MRYVLLTAAALLLSACQPQAPDGSPAQPPADAPAAPTPATAPELPEAFRGDLDAMGTEPFWGVQIRETQISFTTPDQQAPLTAANTGGKAVSGAVVWESVAGDKPLKITLREQPGCSDGMSDLVFPLAAEVVLGGVTYKGCAVKTAERPREGEEPPAKKQ